MFGLKRKNLVLGLAIFFTSVASSQSMAKERTTFDDSTASPRGKMTIKNGQSATFTAVLKAGTKGVPNVPVNVYIGSDPKPNRLKTDRNGRFTLTKTVWITDKIPTGLNLLIGVLNLPVIQLMLGLAHAITFTVGVSRSSRDTSIRFLNNNEAALETGPLYA